MKETKLELEVDNDNVLVRVGPISDAEVYDFYRDINNGDTILEAMHHFTDLDKSTAHLLSENQQFAIASDVFRALKYVDLEDVPFTRRRVCKETITFLKEQLYHYTRTPEEHVL